MSTRYLSHGASRQRRSEKIHWWALAGCSRSVVGRSRGYAYLLASDQINMKETMGVYAIGDERSNSRGRKSYKFHVSCSRLSAEHS
jgi:hypothetical protein